MKTCLIVDHSHQARRALRAIIEASNFFKVFEEEDGQRGLWACEKDLPDVIFVEWEMSPMDGSSFVRKLRQMAGGNKPDVVACSREPIGYRETLDELGVRYSIRKQLRPGLIGILLGQLYHVPHDR